MKPQSERPSDSDRAMRYFTPELLARYGSIDDEEADRADEDWEAAAEAYRVHLDGLRERMPPQVEKLADICLHDAEFPTEAQPEEDFLPTGLGPSPFALWIGLKYLTIKLGDNIIFLTYVLRDHVRRYPVVDPRPSPATTTTCWLYDELDITPGDPAGFVHRILLSDGAVLVIPFATASIRRFSLRGERPGGESRQTA